MYGVRRQYNLIAAAADISITHGDLLDRVSCDVSDDAVTNGGAEANQFVNVLSKL